ncbi:MAG: ATP-binding cassette domain-containing protein [Verrucomicrobiaceae bacterium]|nr:ATP-binding cassette domain-containing protein [Verrucomicrobiaceae bacterium]
MIYIDLTNVSKSFGSGTEQTDILTEINFLVKKGEFIAIVGYSGTGKTTLISLLAGLTKPSGGTIAVDGASVEGPSPQRGVVFQNYSLLPWFTVKDNVALSVNEVYGDASKSEREQRILDSVEQVNLTPALSKRPGELSGGMRQRTSVARTLATNPDILLLDEPLSALDALTRSVIQDQILEIWQKRNQTIILITNDVDEALYMADRVIPLSVGPGATLGPEVSVDLPRPRDRRALHTNPSARKIRHELISYLLAQKEKERLQQSNEPVVLPNISPIDISMHKPSWFRGLRPKKRKVLQSL